MRIAFSCATLAFAVVLSLAISSGEAATYTVNKAADTLDGSCDLSDCSLREALDAANATTATDVVEVSGGVVYQISRGGLDDSNVGGDFDILGNTTIKAVGGGLATIDGNGALTGDRTFHVLAGAVVRFEGLEISGGDPFPGSGGGLLNEGTARVIDCTFIRNRALDGGGIASRAPSAKLSIFDSLIVANHAESVGGGIAANQATIIRTDFINNSAEAAGGGLDIGDGEISGGSVLDNTASNFGGGISAGTSHGGGFISISGVRIEGNVVAFRGGGVAIEGEVEILYSQIIGNKTDVTGLGGNVYSSGATAITQTRIAGGLAGFGGGVYAEAPAVSPLIPSLSIIESTLEDNLAWERGGGVWVADQVFALNASTISDNESRGHGGGAFIGGSASAFVTNSTFAGNHTFYGWGGGAILVDIGASEGAGQPTLDLRHVTMAFNTADFPAARANGIRVGVGAIVVRNSVIDDPCPGSSGITSAGFNAYTGCLAGSAISSDRHAGLFMDLRALANNGGPTWTVSLGPLSAAQNNVKAGCAAMDQRGVARASYCASGAFEPTDDDQ